MEQSHEGPLAGIRVLELGSFVAAPFATRIFADFGADVIKIERPDTGDELRGWRRWRGTTSMMFRTIARSKRSVSLDLRTPEGASTILDLIRRSDVVIENFRPGTLERWNLGPDRLAEANPDIVLVRISGYGQTGPYRHKAGFGGVAEAFGGLRHITGYPDRESVRAAAPIGDVLAGLHGAISALVMLLARSREGNHERPTVADVALYESVFMATESLVPDYDAYGINRERTAGNLPGVVPSGVYQCRNGSVMIAGNSSNAFSRLMREIGRNDLADDPALIDGAARYTREAELDDAITSWTMQRDLDDVVAELDTAGVPVGAILSAADIVDNEQFASRGMLQSVKIRIEDELEEVRLPGVVPQFDGQATSIRWAGPELGEHTEEVLAGLLDYDMEQISQYRGKNVI
ncbi:CaiB/BaiF CoA transferase family protein [Rhodococcoides yunnanense]|uniref:CaiB/BaiF CoA transferase family protein n=1 Tax=Rhodococcoides yunnanense TaxID=278209 RepID=UPI000934D7E5|nr:CoA transferase [Rhodococcus yunnanensis]